MGAEDEPTVGQGLMLTGAYQRRDRLTGGDGKKAVCGGRGLVGSGGKHHASPVRHLTSKVETPDWRHWHK